MGTMIDVEIVTREHAILSASSAERWLVCTPSARIEEGLPDKGSSYATDGTAAHSFAELRLRYKLGQSTKGEYEAAYGATRSLYAPQVEEWTHFDWDAIDSYVTYVLSEVERLGGADATVIIEARIDYSKYAPSGFGTSDVLIYAPKLGIIKSIDLKFGKGVPVSAMNNPQLKLYALGGLIQLDVDKMIDKVEWTVMQPRLDNVSDDFATTKELLDWAENVVAPAAEKAWAGEGEMVPTAKGCRFCKASATCRARAAENVLIARRDFMSNPDPRLMEMDEVARILPDIDAWISWAKGLKDYALEQVRDNEVEVKGYKLVRGRSIRQWAHGVNVPLLLGAQPDVSETDIYEEPKVRSVAQMEEQLGKKKFAELVNALELVKKSIGTPALVPDSDPRPAIDAAKEAAKAFGLDKP